MNMNTKKQKELIVGAGVMCEVTHYQSYYPTSQEG